MHQGRLRIADVYGKGGQHRATVKMGRVLHVFPRWEVGEAFELARSLCECSRPAGHRGPLRV